MRRRPWNLYATASVILFAGLLVNLIAVGAPASVLVVLASVLACALLAMSFVAGAHSRRGNGQDAGRSGRTRAA
jgi:hypothetical protein